MDASTVAASIAQVDRMLNRVEKIIGREHSRKPLRADYSYPLAKPKRAWSESGGPAKPVSSVSTQPPAVASGQLAGNEMRISNGYRPQPSACEDCDHDGMWAAFEADFDDMVARMH